MSVELTILAILVGPWLATLALVQARGEPRVVAAGRYGLAAAFAFFAVAHFTVTDTMAAMFPPWVRAPERLVQVTGVIEGLIAPGLVVPKTRRRAGIAAIAVFLCFFPANVYAALTRADVIGHARGPVYLSVRTPFQALLIVWAWWFVVRRG
ncbi:MAG: DoxX family protein [Oceanicaulis sp.]